MTAPSLRTRLMAGYLVLLAIMGGATVVLAGRALDEQVVASADARLRSQALAVADWMVQAGHPERLAPRLGAVTAAGVQIVDTDGLVVGDSLDPSQLGQRGDVAPEVAAARRDGVGHARRRLVPDGPTSYLLAIRDGEGRVIRLAIPVAELDAAQAKLRAGLLAAGVVGLVAALLIGLAAIRAVTRPLQAMTLAAERLGAGDYRPPSPALPDGADELGVLGRALTTLAAEVEARIAELTAARDLSTAVVEALVEGVVAVDARGEVVLTNRAATTLLGDGAPLPPALADALADARAGIERDDEVVVAERQVRVAARPLPGSAGAVLALYDVTQLRASIVRRDFLAAPPTSCARRSPPSRASPRPCAAARWRRPRPRSSSPRSTATPAASPRWSPTCWCSSASTPDRRASPSAPRFRWRPSSPRPPPRRSRRRGRATRAPPRTSPATSPTTPWCSVTPPASSRSRRTCSTTRSPTAAARSPRAVVGRAIGSCSRSPTTAPASPPRTCRGSSSASTAPIDAPAAAASAWPSSPSRSAPWAAR
ncbi:MAG: HAMP domain-containing protein [Kofleriaceae bacterium]